MDGLLIEPVSSIFDRLRKNLSDNRRFVLERVAKGPNSRNAASHYVDARAIESVPGRAGLVRPARGIPLAGRVLLGFPKLRPRLPEPPKRPERSCNDLLYTLAAGQDVHRPDSPSSESRSENPLGSKDVADAMLLQSPDHLSHLLRRGIASVFDAVEKRGIKKIEVKIHLRVEWRIEIVPRSRMLLDPNVFSVLKLIRQPKRPLTPQRLAETGWRSKVRPAVLPLYQSPPAPEGLLLGESRSQPKRMSAGSELTAIRRGLGELVMLRNIMRPTHATRIGRVQKSHGSLPCLRQ